MLAKLTLERHTISSRESWNRRIDDILDSSFKLTLGNIIKGLGNVVSLDMNTEMEVAEAKNQRDFLVHHFFRENTERLMTPAGRLVMLKDIEKIAGIIQSATEKVDLATGACAKHLGMTDEALETHYQSMIEQLATDDAN